MEKQQPCETVIFKAQLTQAAYSKTCLYFIPSCLHLSAEPRGCEVPHMPQTHLTSFPLNTAFLAKQHTGGNRNFQNLYFSHLIQLLKQVQSHGAPSAKDFLKAYD